MSAVGSEETPSRARTRICRFKDVVPLYASSYDKTEYKIKKVLRHYDPNESGDKNINLSKSIRVDTR